VSSDLTPEPPRSVEAVDALPRDRLPEKTRLRLDEGREIRDRVPRTSHGTWAAPDDRPDPVSILEKQAERRVPELIPIRYGRMLESAFAFFRGGAAIMAWDLSRTPTSDLRVQACGDAHLENFGAFAAPDRTMVFDLNDFDETLPAPFEWDLKRLVASIAIAARDRGFSREDSRRATHAAGTRYRDLIGEFAGMRFLDLWYSRIPMKKIIESVVATGDQHAVKQAKKQVKKAKHRTALGALGRFATKERGEWKIKPEPPLIETVPLDALPGGPDMFDQGLRDYGNTLSPERRLVIERYRFADAARKVVGVGSVGMVSMMILMIGDRDDDPLFLQLKQATESVLAPYAGASVYSHPGERVVQGQRIMQAASDSFLGWVTGSMGLGLDYYVRQLRDMKGSANLTKMDPQALVDYAGLCGSCLAHAHARSGDAATMTGYIGTCEEMVEALSDFAEAYADQNERDFEALVAAEKSGRIEAEFGL
jgi:uncharacterized protein (DUF2252 family)